MLKIINLLFTSGKKFKSDMRVQQYGLDYYRVGEEDLELIRYWRNQDFIRLTMQFSEYITPKMQKDWFHKINNPLNYYFIINYKNKKIGLINCKNTDIDSRIAEGGIFIWDENFFGTPIPVLASLTMMESVFEVFQSGDASIVTVRKDNSRAIVYNKNLGYKYYCESEDGSCVKLILRREEYFQLKNKIGRALKIFIGEKNQFKISGSPSVTQDSVINKFFEKNNFSNSYSD